MRRSQDFMATILSPIQDRTIYGRKRKERATGFEPATPSLGSWHSTAELCPLGARRLKFSQPPILRLVACVFNFITDYAVVDRIISQLKLSFTAAKSPPPRMAFQELLMAAEASGEYFS
jgi:hypothetical protein